MRRMPNVPIALIVASALLHGAVGKSQAQNPTELRPATQIDEGEFRKQREQVVDRLDRIRRKMEIEEQLFAILKKGDDGTPEGAGMLNMLRLVIFRDYADLLSSTYPAIDDLRVSLLIDRANKERWRETSRLEAEKKDDAIEDQAEAIVVDEERLNQLPPDSIEHRKLANHLQDLKRELEDLVAHRSQLERAAENCRAQERDHEQELVSLDILESRLDSFRRSAGIRVEMLRHAIEGAGVVITTRDVDDGRAAIRAAIDAYQNRGVHEDPHQPTSEYLQANDVSSERAIERLPAAKATRSVHSDRVNEILEKVRARRRRATQSAGQVSVRETSTSRGDTR